MRAYPTSLQPEIDSIVVPSKSISTLQLKEFLLPDEAEIVTEQRSKGQNFAFELFWVNPEVARHGLGHQAGDLGHVLFLKSSPSDLLNTQPHARFADLHARIGNWTRQDPRHLQAIARFRMRRYAKQVTFGVRNLNSILVTKGRGQTSGVFLPSVWRRPPRVPKGPSWQWQARLPWSC